MRSRAYFSTESQRFSKTAERGYHILERFLEKNDGGTLSGKQIVYLEKKWGLPNILTAAQLQRKGLAFAEAEYREAVEIWKRQFL